METTGMETLQSGSVVPPYLCFSHPQWKHQVSTAPPEGKEEPQQLNTRSSEPALSFSLLLFLTHGLID